MRCYREAALSEAANGVAGGSGWIRPSDLAAELGLKPSTLQAWRRTGHGPRFAKRGHVVLYSRQAVEEWLLAAERKSTSDRPAAEA